MSEACWTLRSISCQVVYPSFCQQTKHIHLGLYDHLTGMLVRCFSGDVSCCDWGKKKPTKKTQNKNEWFKMSQPQCWKQLPFGKFSNTDHFIVLQVSQRKISTKVNWYSWNRTGFVLSRKHIQDNLQLSYAHLMAQKWMRYYLQAFKRVVDNLTMHI